MADESPTIDEIQRQNKCLRRCGNEFLDFENMIVDLHYGGKMPLGEALARLAEARGLHEQCLERCIPIGRYFTNAQKVKFEKCRNAGFAFTAAGLLAGALIFESRGLAAAAPSFLISGGLLAYTGHYLELAEDPIDSNFSEVPVPTFPQFPAVQPVPNTGLNASVAAATDAVMANQAQGIGFLNALVTALNRSDGAAKAGDEAAEKRQLKAARDFAKKIAKIIKDSISLRSTLATKWKGPGLDFPISKADALQVRDAIVLGGFPSPFLDVLETAGIDETYRKISLQRLRVELTKLQIRRTTFRKLFTDFLRDPKLRTAELGAASSLEQFSRSE
jgi:hypothetical protein